MHIEHKIAQLRAIAAVNARREGKKAEKSPGRWTLTALGLFLGSLYWAGCLLLGWDGTDSAMVAIPSATFIGLVLDFLRTS